MLRSLALYKKSSTCFQCRMLTSPSRLSVQQLDKAYTEDEKTKILEVMNESNDKDLSSYDITKSRIKKVVQWKDTFGHLKTIEDIRLIDGFADKYAKKLFDSILKGPVVREEVKTTSSKIRGQVLLPTLSETARQKCKLVLAVYVSVNSICWTLVNRHNYEVIEWNYHPIDYPDAKRLQITDIMHIAWKVTRLLPYSDLYVMKAEATTLRASGSDPNNPKMLAVNLQKSQLIAMMVALINTRSNHLEDSQHKHFTEEEPKGEMSQEDKIFKHKVYFLRPTLPYRLYGTLVGNERVSTDQTVEMLLQNMYQKSDEDRPKYEPYISDQIKTQFRSQNELQRDMLGHCLLLALTFMDLCIYKKQESINKLVKRGE